MARPGRIRRWLSCVLWMLLLQLPLPAVQAQDRERVVSQTLEVIDLLPEGFNRSSAEEALYTLLRVRPGSWRLQMAPPEEALLESLRWSLPDATQATCEREAPEQRQTLASARLTRPPREDAELLPLFMEQARVQLQQQQWDAALTSIQEAQRRLRCVLEPLDRETLSRLFWMEALARAQLKDGMELSAFQDAFNLDETLHPDREASRLVQSAFTQAKKQWQRLPKSTLELGSLTGTLYLDGDVISPGWQSRPGRHLLQLKSTLGALRSWLITIPRQERVELEALLELELKEFPSQDGIRLMLTGALRSGRLEPYQETVLVAYLRQRDISFVAFALEAPGGRKLMFRAFRTHQGLIDASDLQVLIAPRRQKQPQLERQSPGPALMGGIAMGFWGGGAGRYVENQSRPAGELELDLPMGEWMWLATLGMGSRPPLPAAYQHTCSSDAVSVGTLGLDPCNLLRGYGWAFSGISRPWLPLGQLWLIPSGGLKASLVPNLVLQTGQDGGATTELVDLIMLGPSIRLEVRRGWFQQRLQVSGLVQSSVQASVGPTRAYLLPEVLFSIRLGAGFF